MPTKKKTPLDLPQHWDDYATNSDNKSTSISQRGHLQMRIIPKVSIVCADIAVGYLYVGVRTRLLWSRICQKKPLTIH